MHYSYWIIEFMTGSTLTHSIILRFWPHARCVSELSCFSGNYEHLIWLPTLFVTLGVFEWVYKPNVNMFELVSNNITCKVTPVLLFQFWIAVRYYPSSFCSITTFVSLILCAWFQFPLHNNYFFNNFHFLCLCATDLHALSFLLCVTFFQAATPSVYCLILVVFFYFILTN